MAGPSPSSGEPLLSVRDVSVRFGGIVALDGVTFDVFAGQVAGLIGPNGAGKTTLFNCLSRLYTPNSGDIRFEGRTILDRPRHAIPQIGIGRTFQNVALFDRMSVLDNVKVGCHSKSSTSFLENALRLPRVKPEEKRIAERAHELIAFMDLESFTNATAGGLPFPIRKRVELARALASSPKLLLLDEPAAGLNHEAATHMVIKDLNLYIILIFKLLCCHLRYQIRFGFIFFTKIIEWAFLTAYRQAGEVKSCPIKLIIFD